MRAVLVPATVMMLMVSTGMSLRLRGVLARWRSVSECYLAHRDALPAVACYAVAAFLIMAVYAWSARHQWTPQLRPGGAA